METKIEIGIYQAVNFENFFEKLLTPTQRNSLRYVYREEEMTMMTVNAVSVVEQYNRDLAEWEYQVSRKPTAATKEQHRPPERQSVLKHLREIQERNKQQPPQRQYKKSIDRDSR